MESGSLDVIEGLEEDLAATPPEKRASASQHFPFHIKHRFVKP
jgi:hypothetical protein